MDNADWSEELRDLERRLAERVLPEPGPAVRERVLTALNREVRASERESFWNFTMGLAAVFLLGANLSTTSAPLVRGNGIDAPETTAAAARRLHTLVPTLTAEAAQAEILMASSWSRLPRVPNMGAATVILKPETRSRSSPR